MTLRFMTRLATLIVAIGITFSPATAQTVPAASASVPLRFSVKNRLVSVAVERGVQQVVLEKKVGDGWKPLSVAYPSARSGRASFNLTTAMPASDLRALGYRTAKFPARFLRGKRSFDRKDLSANTLSSGHVLMSGAVTLNGTTALAVADTRSATTTTQTIVESDIWQIVGDQVYFFNQYRGLQILDMSDPMLPVRTGSLRLPASGEQMFVLDAAGTQVALLGRSNDKARQGAATIWLIRVTDGVPAMVGEVPLEGAITDSRLTGTTLHVLCSVWTQATITTNWTSEAVLTSIDLSNLDAPTKLGALRFPSSNAVLQAAGGHLLIGTQNYIGTNGTLQNALHLIDISAAPMLVKTFTPRGQIQDKFKLGIVGDAVVAISLDRRNWSDRQTWVETFPIAGSTVTPLAALELEGARGETLYATRFDGDRLYVVTFRQIDPLFIVDLADPAAPVLSGVLEVPGWSTYLEPLGDQLLAVGVESGHVTVSLFDVADVTAPALLSRIALGPEGGYSWSEANYDEKAVEYLPNEGVVMVPFETWNWNTGTQQKAIQVVNVGTDALTAGATIEHNFNPRRGSFIAGHFVSISGQELLVHSTTSATPVVRLPLAWRTDRVVPVGDSLVQIEDGQSNYGYGVISLRSISSTSGSAKLRITSATDPDALEQVIDLGAGQIVSQTQKDDRLYLAQWIPAAENQPQTLRTLALDLTTTPPVITETDRAEHDLSGLNSYDLRLDAVQPLWVSADKLVWYVPMQAYQNWWWYGGGSYISIMPVFTAMPVLRLSTTDNLATTNAVTASAPPPAAILPTPTPGTPAAVLCPVTLDTTGIIADTAQVVRVKGTLRGTSSAFTQSGFIYLSYDVAVEAPVTKQPTLTTGTLQRSRVGVIGIPYRPYDPRVASWLQVIDWRATTPVLRDPVSIPGALLSVAQADAQGAVILTNSDQKISTTAPATRVIQASGYDGISAWQIDSYITATPYHSATATDGMRIYLGREAGTVGVVGVGYNNTTGRLAQINSWPTAEIPAMLNVISGHLLASSYGNLEVATITASTGALTPVASYDTPTNLWLRVDRAAFTPSQDLWIPAGDYGVELLQRAALAP